MPRENGTLSFTWSDCLLDSDGRQKYAFLDGDTVRFEFYVVDTLGTANINQGAITCSVVSPVTQAVTLTITTEDSTTLKCTGTYAISTTYRGLVQVDLDAANLDPLTIDKSVFFKIRDEVYEPDRTFTLGALITNFGFSTYSGAGLTSLIADYAAITGLDVWKQAINWSLMEATEGVYNTTMLDGLVTFLDAAQTNGKTVQLSLRQDQLPAWIVDRKNTDYMDVDSFHNANSVAKFWVKVLQHLAGHTALHSILIVNEMNESYIPTPFVRFYGYIASAIWQEDDTVVVGIRPNNRYPYLRTLYCQDGPQDIDYGTSYYPTLASTSYTLHGNPVSTTSYGRMAMSYTDSKTFGGRMGVGEIGFRDGASDTFTDADRVTAIKRAMEKSYDLGHEEFHLWGLTFGFEDWSNMAALKTFRDQLITRPRRNLQALVVIDVGDYSGNEFVEDEDPQTTVLNVCTQPYFFGVEYLDERGINWAYTNDQATPLQPSRENIAVLKLSQLTGLGRTLQRRKWELALHDRKFDARPLPWPTYTCPSVKLTKVMSKRAPFWTQRFFTSATSTQIYNSDCRLRGFFIVGRTASAGNKPNIILRNGTSAGAASVINISASSRYYTQEMYTWPSESLNSLYLEISGSATGMAGINVFFIPED